MQCTSPVSLLSSSSLLPRAPYPQQTTRRARKPYNPIVQINPLQRSRRKRYVAQVAQQLDLDRRELLVHLLLLHHLFRVGGARGNAPRALQQVVVRVDARGDGEGDAREPGAVAFAGEARGERVFVDVGCVELGKGKGGAGSLATVLGTTGLPAGSPRRGIRTTHALSQSM